MFTADIAKTSFCTRETAEPFKLRRCSRQLFEQLQESKQVELDGLKDVFLALFGGDREEIGVLDEDEERGSLALGRWPPSPPSPDTRWPLSPPSPDTRLLSLLALILRWPLSPPSPDTRLLSLLALILLSTVVTILTPEEQAGAQETRLLSLLALRVQKVSIQIPERLANHRDSQPGCQPELSPGLQALLRTYESLVTRGRQEGEWVMYCQM